MRLGQGLEQPVQELGLQAQASERTGQGSARPGLALGRWEWEWPAQASSLTGPELGLPAREWARMYAAVAGLGRETALAWVLGREWVRLGQGWGLQAQASALQGLAWERRALAWGLAWGQRDRGWAQKALASARAPG